MPTYEFPRPALTTDVIVHTRTHVLLIERGHEPFEGMWALPGGHVDEGETVETAAVRELEEETSLRLAAAPTLLGVYSKPGRDPRTWNVSVVYRIGVGAQPEAQAGDDARQVRWFSWDAFPKLAFDHSDMLCDAYPYRNEIILP